VGIPGAREPQSRGPPEPGAPYRGISGILGNAVSFFVINLINYHPGQAFKKLKMAVLIIHQRFNPMIWSTASLCESTLLILRNSIIEITV
jgi:hypothetical protein